MNAAHGKLNPTQEDLTAHCILREKRKKQKKAKSILSSATFYFSIYIFASSTNFWHDQTTLIWKTPIFQSQMRFCEIKANYIKSLNYQMNALLNT